MRDYGTIPTSIWTDPLFLNLSRDAKLLAFYLMSSSHTTMIGCFRLPISYVSEDLNFPAGTVRELFRELLDNGFATYDEPSKHVLLTSFFSWNRIDNPNQTKSAIKLLEQLADDVPLKPMAVQAFSENAAALTKPEDEPWRNRSRTLVERFRTQKQKQDPKQDQFLPSQDEEPREVVALPRTRAHTRGADGSAIGGDGDWPLVSGVTQ